MEMEVQTIRGRGRRGARPRGCHGVDGVEDGGEEVLVGETWIRRRRWAARVPVPFGPVPTLAGNGGVGGERRGGAGVLPVGLAPSQIGRVFVGGVCGGREPRDPSPGTSPVLYSAGDGGPPAIWAGRPRSGRVQGVRPDLCIGPVEINSNNT